MRVRTGKIIKTRTINGQQNISKSSSGNVAHVCFKKDNSFIFDSQLGATSDAKHISIIAGHKYFCFVKLNFTPTGTTRFIMYKGDGTTNTDANSPNTYIDNYYHCSVNTCNNTNTDAHLNFYLNTYQQFNTVYFGGCIDLTTIGLDTLTAQEFYNKYKDKLELLATGEEIVLDSKTGKIMTESISNMFISSNRTINVGGTGVSGNGWNGSNLSINAFSNQNNYTNVIYSFTDSGFTVQASRSDFVNGVALEVPFKVKGNCTYKITYDYEGASSYLDYFQYNNSYIRSGLSVNNGVFTTNYDTEWIVIRFRAPGAGTVGTYSNVKLVRQTPISCNPAVKMYGYNQKANDVWSLYKTENGTLTNPNDFEWQLTFGSSGVFHSYLLQDSTPNPTIGHKFLTILDIKVVTSTLTGNLQFVYRRVSGNSYMPNKITINTDGEWHTYTNIYTQTSYSGSDGRTQIVVSGYTGIAEGDIFAVRNVQIIDLTDWFGEGKEPTTVAEFKEKFSKDYYGYCPNIIRLTQGMINALPTYKYSQGFKHLASNVEFRVPSNILPNMTIAREDNKNMFTCNFLNSNGIGQAFYGFCPQFNSGDRCLLTFEAYSNKVTVDGISLYSGVSHTNEVYEKYTSADLGTWKRIGEFATYTSSWTTTNSTYYRFINCGAHTAGDTLQIRNIEFINLTQWFGAGNEPATIAEFQAMFPHKFYQYIVKSLLNRYQINALGVD